MFLLVGMLFISTTSTVLAEDTSLTTINYDETQDEVIILDSDTDITIFGLSPSGEALYNKTISSATWIVRDGEISLSIVWKDDIFNYSYSSVFQLLVNIFSGSSKWPDTSTANGTMRDQFECHYKFATSKKPWNLEPWRTYVGYARTVLAACNP